MNPIVRSLPLAAALALLAPTPSPAQEPCPGVGPQPMVCSLEVRVERDGRWREHSVTSNLAIEAGGRLELAVLGIDQYGRPFPAERAGIVVEPGRGCSGLVEVQDHRDGRFRLSGGTDRGECRLLLWVPGNLNLEWELGVEVSSAAAHGYSRQQAEYIAARLYRAVLGREPDSAGLGAAVTEIQRDRLGDQVRSMCSSSEYRAVRQRLSPTGLLDQIYRGLLARPPDSSAVRTYLRKLEKNKAAPVVLDIVRSEEFERAMIGATEPRKVRFK